MFFQMPFFTFRGLGRGGGGRGQGDAMLFEGEGSEKDFILERGV